MLANKMILSVGCNYYFLLSPKKKILRGPFLVPRLKLAQTARSTGFQWILIFLGGYKFPKDLKHFPSPFVCQKFIRIVDWYTNAKSVSCQ